MHHSEGKACYCKSDNEIENTEDKQLKNLLIETRENLLEIEGDLGPEHYSLRNYPDIWNPRSVLAGKLNLSLFETMPNILIGIGLMFTFIFLAIALNDAGQAMDSSNTSNARDSAMKALIGNAGGKFITSITGLLCSLLWNWQAKVQIERLQSSVNELHYHLRKVAPDTAAQAVVKSQDAVFRELLKENREQVGQLKRFETDIAVAIAKAIGCELQPAFKSLGSELTEAIKALTDRIGNMNEDALQRMISQFIEEFRGSSTSEMKEFKEALINLALNLERAGTKITADVEIAGSTFGAAAGSLETAISKAEQTVTKLDASFEKAGSVVEQGSERFEAISDKLLSNIRSVDALLGGVDSFVSKMQQTVGTINSISDSLEDAVNSQKEVSTQFKEGIPLLAKGLASAVEEINSSANAASNALSTIRVELEKTKDSLDQTVTSLSTGVDQYTDKVKSLHLILDEKIGQAIASIGASVNGLTEAFEDIADAMQKSKQ